MRWAVVLLAAGVLTVQVPAFAQFNRSGARVSGTAVRGSTMLSSRSSIFGSRSLFGGTSGSFGSLGGFGSSLLSTPAPNRGQFVGRDTGDVTNPRSLVGTNQRGSTGTSYNRQYQSSFNRYSSTRQYQQPRQSQTYGRSYYGRTGSRFSSGEISARVSVGFNFQPPSPQQNVQQLLSRLQTENKIAVVGDSISVDVKDGIALVRGAVASTHDRLLVERLLLLEPGIRKVDNQLEVKQPEEEQPGQ